MDQQLENHYAQEEVIFFSKAEKIIDKNTDLRVVALSKKNQRINTSAIAKKCENEFFSELMKELGNHIKELSIFLTQLNIDDIALHNKINNSISEPEKIDKLLKNCKTLKDVRNLSANLTLVPEELKRLYKLGERWFEKGDFEKSLLYFLFLTAFDSSNFENWLARGMSEQNLGRLDEALASYSMAIKLDPNYLLTYLQIIDCLILNKQLDAARQLYTMFINNTNPQDYSHNAFFILIS